MTNKYRQKAFTLSFILIIVQNVSFGQVDKPCGKIYQMSDTLPKLISSGQRIAEIVSSQIHIPDTLKNKEGRIDIQYVVNCHGKNVKFTVLTMHDYNRKPIPNDFIMFGPKIISILKKDIKWAPAWEGGNRVDFLLILSVEFRENIIGVNLTGEWYLAPTKQ